MNHDVLVEALYQIATNQAIDTREQMIDLAADALCLYMQQNGLKALENGRPGKKDLEQYRKKKLGTVVYDAVDDYYYVDE